MSSPAKKQASTSTKNQPVGTTTTAWQGPLPPPEAVQKFDTIVENGAERIFRMAEIEQQHRIQSDQIALNANVEASKSEAAAARRGAWMAFAMSVLAIVGAIFTAYLGSHWFVSVALVSLPVMGVVRTLITRK